MQRKPFRAKPENKNSPFFLSGSTGIANHLVLLSSVGRLKTVVPQRAHTYREKNRHRRQFFNDIFCKGSTSQIPEKWFCLKYIRWTPGKHNGINSVLCHTKGFTQPACREHASVPQRLSVVQEHQIKVPGSISDVGIRHQE